MATEQKPDPGDRPAQIINITKANPELFRWIEEGYKVLEECFPEQEDLEPQQKIEDMITGKYQNLTGIGQIVGDNLNSRKGHVVKAFAVAILYDQQSAGLLAYNGVRPEFRGAGLGKITVPGRIGALQDAAVSTKHGELRSAMIQCVNPETEAYVIKPGDIPPQERIAQFAAWGARRIPLSQYYMPLYDEEGNLSFSTKMILLSYPINGKYPSPKDVENMLRGELREGRSDVNPDNIPQFRAMKAELDVWALDPKGWEKALAASAPQPSNVRPIRQAFKASNQNAPRVQRYTGFKVVGGVGMSFG